MSFAVVLLQYLASSLSPLSLFAPIFEYLYEIQYFLFRFRRFLIPLSCKNKTTQWATHYEWCKYGYAYIERYSQYIFVNIGKFSPSYDAIYEFLRINDSHTLAQRFLLFESHTNTSSTVRTKWFHWCECVCVCE